MIPSAAFRALMKPLPSIELIDAVARKKVARKHARPLRSLETHLPGKYRRRPNPLLASLSQTLPTFFYATARQKTVATLHSQKDFRAPTHNPIDRGLCATDVHRLVVIVCQEFGILSHVAQMLFRT
jgi:hypothetical protein